MQARNFLMLVLNYIIEIEDDCIDCEPKRGNRENEEQTNKVNVYPNPANNIVNFVMQKPINGHIEIKNQLGQVIYRQQLNNNKQVKVDVTELSNGMYMYEVYEDKILLQSNKIVINK